MEFMAYYGAVLCLISLLMFFKPNWLIRMNKMGEKVVFTDSSLFTSPKISGALFIAIGFFLIYLGYYLKDMQLN